MQMGLGIFNKKSAFDLTNRGLEYLKKGKYDDAFREFDKAIEIDPQYAMAWLNKGKVILYYKKNYIEALKMFDEVNKLDPQNAMAWTLRGNALLELGKPDEALQAYDNAVQVDPKFAMAWNNKSVVFRMQGNYEEALQLVNKAIGLLGPGLEKEAEIIRHNKREIEKKMGTFKEEERTISGIVDNQVQILLNNGKLWSCPLDQVKLVEITDTHISMAVKGSFLPKLFYFNKENKEVFERIADALPSDIWYRDATAMTHIASYSNVNDANKEANLAAQKGWMPQGSSTTDGNYNIGAGLGSAFVLGPIGLLAAANKTGGKITITYVRTPGWLASH
ncbi:MAG: hypothetical protein STSR0001_09410 [Methanothrix sp.]|jgi:Tfp pilus assembly protein PilF